MILLNRKRPISALKLIHTLNHTQINRFCDIDDGHINFIKTLEYNIGERIYDLRAGLYKIIIDGLEYIIDVYFDIGDKHSGDFLEIKNKDNIIAHMAGSTPYPIAPYKINSVSEIISYCDIDSVNDNIDIIVVGGITDYGKPSLTKPCKINRRSSINITTESNSNSDSLTIPLKHTLGMMSNGARDYIIINADQLIAHVIINTSKEILSAGLKWEYKEEYSNSEYYVFFAKYEKVKINDESNSIRCSHFESASHELLVRTSTRRNCIAVSCDGFENGIWLKIKSSLLDIHGNKNFGDELSKWILNQNVSTNPIYIEYELSNTVYDTILIDEYHIKTWFPNTTINISKTDGFSVFYKASKSL